jgi:hypothetical protein
MYDSVGGASSSGCMYPPIWQCVHGCASCCSISTPEDMRMSAHGPYTSVWVCLPMRVWGVSMCEHAIVCVCVCVYVCVCVCVCVSHTDSQARKRSYPRGPPFLFALTPAKTLVPSCRILCAVVCSTTLTSHFDRVLTEGVQNDSAHPPQQDLLQLRLMEHGTPLDITRYASAHFPHHETLPWHTSDITNIARAHFPHYKTLPGHTSDIEKHCQGTSLTSQT